MAVLVGANVPLGLDDYLEESFAAGTVDSGWNTGVYSYVDATSFNIAGSLTEVDLVEIAEALVAMQSQVDSLQTNIEQAQEYAWLLECVRRGKMTRVVNPDGTISYTVQDPSLDTDLVTDVWDPATESRLSTFEGA